MHRMHVCHDCVFPLEISACLTLIPILKFFLLGIIDLSSLIFSRFWAHKDMHVGVNLVDHPFDQMTLKKEKEDDRSMRSLTF